MNIRELTPEAMRCIIGNCPAIFETDRGTYLIIGRKIDMGDSIGNISARVGENETIIEIPKILLSNI